MRIIITSDTHGYNRMMDVLIPYLEEADVLIHAGDYFSDSVYLHKRTGIDTYAVLGNCDFARGDKDLTFELEGRTFFLTHGHKYGVKYGLDELIEEAELEGADIVIFGHTHYPLAKVVDGMLIINPGSLCMPMGVDYRSFVIMDIVDGKLSYEFVKL